MTSLRRAVGRGLYRTLELLPASALERLQGAVARHPRLRAVLRRAGAPARDGVHPIAAGPARGMLIDVAGSRPSYVLGTAERDMQDFLAAHLRAGDVVFDLGANVGFFTLVAAALVGPSGRVVAYEPLPTNAVALRRNVGLNELANVEVVEAAVSAAVGTAELDPNGSDQEGSLVVHRGSATISVPTVSVDAEADRLAVAPTLVKIDVEGAEGDVLTGMMRTLGTARPIVVCEVHQHHHDLSDPIPAALRAAGYDVTWLEPEAQSPDGFWAPHLVGVPRR